MKNIITLLVSILFAVGPTKNMLVWETDDLLGSDGAVRTVMIYMVGSDLESQYAQATMDLQEMIESGADLSRINVVIAAGGTTGWASLGLVNGQVSVFRLTKEGNHREPLDRVTVRNMGTSDTLSWFLRLAASACPADKYDLILWNHGGGPLFGYGHDSSTDDVLQMEEITSALAQAGYGAGNKLEMIVYDACLMGSIEVAALMASYADYMVASEEAVSGSGLDYHFLGDSAIYTGDTEKIIQNICMSFEKSMGRYKDVDYTMSGLRLSRAPRVWQSMNDLFLGDGNAVSTGDYPMIAACIHKSCAFSRFFSGGEYDLFDLGDFANQARTILPNSASNLRGEIEQMMVCSVSNMEGASGVSFYFPMYAPEYASLYLNNICSLMKSQGLAQVYPAFLQACLNGQTDGTHSFPLPTVQGTVTPGAPTYSAVLSPEQHASFVRGLYYILTPYGDDPEAYRLVERCDDVNLSSDGILMVSREKKFHYFRLDPSMPWKELTLYGEGMQNGTQRYLMMLEVMHMPFDRPDEWRSGSMRLQLEVSRDNPAGTLKWLIPEAGNGMASRELFQLEKGDIIFSVQPVLRKTYDQNGTLLSFHEWPKWNPNGSQGVEGTFSEMGFETSWRAGEANRDYYIQLVMMDAAGNALASDLLLMR